MEERRGEERRAEVGEAAGRVGLSRSLPRLAMFNELHAQSIGQKMEKKKL